MREPVFDGYFADPFLARFGDEYVAYGSGDPTVPTRGFEALRSKDLRTWESVGTVFTGGDPALGDSYWAPEVAFADDTYWMYYSVGHGIAGHHIRVATSESPFGPFEDVGVNLTPEEGFAIDAHPFLDADGSRYLFFARDVLESERPGTHLAAKRMTSMTSVESATTAILSPDSDWQIYERARAMYGEVYDWHTLEGPTVVQRDDGYHLFFSGGSWEGDGYGVSVATAAGPLGPWFHDPAERADVLSTAITGLLGPGHNSVLQRPGTADLIAYHAWDLGRTRRQMYIDRLDWTDDAPTVLTELG
jgi:arabinan endo-1,5-alpha-L-arabinosidase